jgi:hypothetical protein
LNDADAFEAVPIQQLPYHLKEIEAVTWKLHPKSGLGEQWEKH